MVTASGIAPFAAFVSAAICDGQRLLSSTGIFVRSGKRAVTRAICWAIFGGKGIRSRRGFIALNPLGGTLTVGLSRREI